METLSLDSATFSSTTMLPGKANANYNCQFPVLFWISRGCLELCNLSACELVKTVNQELGGQGWMEQMFALSYEKPKVDHPCKLAHHFRNRLEEEMEEDEDEGEDGEGDATGDEEEDNENMLDSGESEGLHMMPFLVTNSNADNSDYGGYCHDNFT